MKHDIGISSRPLRAAARGMASFVAFYDAVRFSFALRFFFYGFCFVPPSIRERCGL